jgi:hypothetical protein
MSIEEMHNDESACMEQQMTSGLYFLGDSL